MHGITKTSRNSQMEDQFWKISSCQKSPNETYWM